jgi:hypothetical protein
MCQRATCPSCQKPTFAGCGRHVEQVLGNVPVDQRCKCREEDADGQQASGGDASSMIKRMFGL